MATDAFNRTIPPATGVTPDWRGMIEDFSASIYAPIPVANTTARTSLAAAIVSAGYTITSAHPLFVYRADAPAGWRTEYSEDGTNWSVLSSKEVLPDPVTTAANGSPTVAGNTIRDDAGGAAGSFAYTFDAVAGQKYNIFLSGALLNGDAGDIYTVQLRIAQGALPTGASTLVAATQERVGTTGSAGRQNVSIWGSWKCPTAGSYTVASLYARSSGTGTGTPISALAGRSIWASPA